ncbi:DUF305 domain-containing protein [uncultured Bosea sp.]|uniref:DUF305 domain-containing protein n=1 Tax=uncultured Bosea sp. TaxID=211457 RepID=UPI0025F060AE|nr:DUF305 domain-containing protein [uncultured Bosea sp.]
MEHGNHHKGQNHYGRLAIELTLDFIVMYLVMYTMIAALGHFHLNLNNVYMTLMMVAPMTLIMLVSMRSMFPSQRLNMIIGAGALAVFVGGFIAMRTQAGIGNAEFLRSMIPHHSGGILMCEKANITDPEIVALCREIIKSQSQEIAQMEAILARQR